MDYFNNTVQVIIIKMLHNTTTQKAIVYCPVQWLLRQQRRGEGESPKIQIYFKTTLFRIVLYLLHLRNIMQIYDGFRNTVAVAKLTSNLCISWVK